MKVEMTEMPAKPRFPRIMWVPEDGTVVLFHDTDKGTVIKQGDGPNPRPLGEYGSYWEMYDFKDYEGAITLSND